jgi:hypothetical protein
VLKFLHVGSIEEVSRPVYSLVKCPDYSVLLHELTRAPNLDAAFTSAAASPLFHAIGATHSYVRRYFTFPVQKRLVHHS